MCHILAERAHRLRVPSRLRGKDQHATSPMCYELRWETFIEPRDLVVYANAQDGMLGPGREAVKSLP